MDGIGTGVDIAEEIGQRFPWLYPYQREGVEFLLNTGGRAILADEMGLGKTVQALAVAEMIEPWPVVVVAPKSLLGVWRDEIARFFPHRTVQVVASEEDLRNDNYHFYLVNYERIISRRKKGVSGKRAISSVLRRLERKRSALLILDEAHYVKSRRSQRTKAVCKLSGSIEFCLMLTGTPLLNRLSELYSLLHILEPTLWNSFWDYAIRYCAATKGYFGWDVSGASNVEELRGRLYPYMIRRRKDEVMKDLPDLVIQRIHLELSPPQRREYRQAFDEFFNWLLENYDPQRAFAAMGAEALTKVTYLKQLLARFKMMSISDLLEGASSKVVVFSQYLAVVRELHKKYPNSITLTGATRDVSSQVNRFQTDDTIQYLFSTTKKGGLGITLTAANTVIFADLMWTPADHDQAMARLHRIGQKNSVHAFYLTFDDTLEDCIFKLLEEKQRVISAVLEDEEVYVGESVFKELLRTLIQRGGKEDGRFVTGGIVTEDQEGSEYRQSQLV